MNLVLFESSERNVPIPRSDPRVRHIIEILKCVRGDSFDAGEVNGMQGKAVVKTVHDEYVEFSWEFNTSPLPLSPITLVTGLPRPQSARDILRDATSLGVERMLFVSTEKGEKSYSHSKLWRKEMYRQHLLKGAETAFSTLLPEVHLLPSLDAALPLICDPGLMHIALDNYEATESLATFVCAEKKKTGAATGAVIAVGSERGWSDNERELFRNSGYTLATLGKRVLRTETAVTAGVSLLDALINYRGADNRL